MGLFASGLIGSQIATARRIRGLTSPSQCEASIDILAVEKIRLLRRETYCRKLAIQLAKLGERGADDVLNADDAALDLRGRGQQDRQSIAHPNSRKKLRRPTGRTAADAAGVVC